MSINKKKKKEKRVVGHGLEVIKLKILGVTL